MKTCEYFLEITNSRLEGKGGQPLDLLEGNRLELCDAIYEAVDVDYENGTEEEAPHYCKVMDAIEPILNLETKFVKANIDGIDYTFELLTNHAWV